MEALLLGSTLIRGAFWAGGADFDTARAMTGHAYPQASRRHHGSLGFRFVFCWLFLCSHKEKDSFAEREAKQKAKQKADPVASRSQLGKPLGLPVIALAVSKSAPPAQNAPLMRVLPRRDAGTALHMSSSVSSTPIIEVIFQVRSTCD